MNREQAYIERAIEENELDMAYEWFFDRYTPEEQVNLIERFEMNPIEFAREARCDV